MEMEKKKRILYSVEDLNKAVNAIRSGMPFKAASKIFKVPRSTLQDKVKGRTALEKKCGPETILTKEEKNVLAWLFRIAARGFPATKTMLLDSVQLLVKELNRPNNFTDNRSGRKWYELFLRRHQKLAPRISQDLSSARNNLTENRIRQWFIEVGAFLEESNYLRISDDPGRVFNCDETAFFLSPKGPNQTKGDKVLVRKGDRTVYSFVSNSEKECLTTLVTCSASGQILPSMIVFN
ncbi:uncharacterized protein LOC115879086 isoform X2 [Sitophilus oryzae]|uniref:Uncharacterized protein LOC115879086 isoform X2 n=1 Tax=Sitophilus oryzae TaxID=7048 RepID=A0A6J2XL22_SITOR|nr:uncharacterized protein LOC115879086 isoform X2 [Sitophilus oryzae]